MIRYKRQVTEKEFYKWYLQLYSLNQNSIEHQLTEREIELAAELLASESENPFHGRERTRIMRKMSIKTSNFSVILRALIAKGIIVKRESKDTSRGYEFHKHMMMIKTLYNNELINPLEIRFEFNKQ